MVEEPSAGLSRRELLLRTAGVAGLVAAGPTALASTTEAALAKTGGSLIVAEPGEPKTLDPHRSTLDVFRHTIRSAVFDTLTWVDPVTLKVKPELARSWDISPNGRQVTFHLERGVTWHDGTPFTARDVAFTIKRVKDPKIQSQFAPQVATVKSVTVVDDHTVRFNLTAPTPPLLANLLQVQIVTEKSIGQVEKNPVGTGPFKFVEWVPGDHFTIAKNPNYWRKGQPMVDELVFKVIPDAQARLANLRAGSVHLIDTIDPKDVAQVKRFPNSIVFTSKPINLYEIFQINTKKPPFDDKRVRQALSYAFDRKSYLDKFWFGFARLSLTPFVKEMPAYLASADTMYKFDLDKAAALLKEAGFTKQKPLKMEILNPLGYPTLHAMSVLLQDNLGKLGHKITVRDLELSAWIDKIAAHPTFDITTDVYNTVPEDPAGMFNSDNLAPTTNINRWNPAGYAALVNAAATEIKPGKRVALYRQLQKLLLDEVPMIVVDHYPLIMASAKNVAGLKLGSSGIYDWSTIHFTS